MSIYDDPEFEQEFVYLDGEAAEFGMQAIDPAEVLDALARDEAGYPEELPAELFDEDGELVGEDGDLDERR
ncbi:hypothetical protein VSS74_01530 [Conexibacter stalactiti]|uniref:Uncharacterized protein n=1 Tax=Conexibacter stalactiti TaxID=1940611 RepID=A0ABU4HLT9_9ACTN|nr:hypothetical protein [Conexibacter stalactiti]MDW5592999.1 hypothetical protein [Conexibacter stalactiti]MEC5033640.1 hypothetical protein [Conexibacter stalactiti]